MTSFNELEDNLKQFIIREQSDAHSVRGLNTAKYNNLKIFLSPSIQEKHFCIRIAISEAAFSIENCTKISGGLGYEERFILKWFGRIGVKDKLSKLWDSSKKD